MFRVQHAKSVDGFAEICGDAMSKKLMPALLIALFVVVGLAGHPQAYIDAGTGSYLMQVLLAGVFGMIVSAKSLWGKVREVLKSSAHEQHR